MWVWDADESDITANRLRGAVCWPLALNAQRHAAEVIAVQIRDRVGRAITHGDDLAVEGGIARGCAADDLLPDAL